MSSGQYEWLTLHILRGNQKCHFGNASTARHNSITCAESNGMESGPAVTDNHPRKRRTASEVLAGTAEVANASPMKAVVRHACTITQGVSNAGCSCGQCQSSKAFRDSAHTVIAKVLPSTPPSAVRCQRDASVPTAGMDPPKQV